MSTFAYDVFAGLLGIAGILGAIFLFKKYGRDTEKPSSTWAGILALGLLYPFARRYAKKRQGTITRREAAGLWLLVLLFLIVSIWSVIRDSQLR